MFKFHFNKVYKYVKGKSIVDLFFETIAFGVLMPLHVNNWSSRQCKYRLWYLLLIKQITKVIR